MKAMSRPPRARGLKPWAEPKTDIPTMSRPPRARGLKQQQINAKKGEIGRAPRGRVD